MVTPRKLFPELALHPATLEVPARLHGEELFLRRDLLAGNRLGLALTGARIGMRALSANRKTLTMAQTAIAAQVHQTLYVHRNFATEVAFDFVVLVDVFADFQDFAFGQRVDALCRIDSDAGANLKSVRRSDSKDITQRYVQRLCRRNVYACNTSHFVLQKNNKNTALARKASRAKTEFNFKRFSPNPEAKVAQYRDIEHRVKLLGFTKKQAITLFYMHKATRNYFNQ